MLQYLASMKSVAGFKAIAVPMVAGGCMTVGAILGAADGTIDESTGIAIGFVGGIIVATATGAWFFRGLIDGMKADVKAVRNDHEHEIQNLKTDNARMKKKLQLD